VNGTFDLSLSVNVQHTGKRILCTETAQCAFHCICNYVVLTTRVLKISQTNLVKTGIYA